MALPLPSSRSVGFQPVCYAVSVAVRALNADTDGVTSEWAVPLDSGPAAARDHLTVIVSVPGDAPATNRYVVLWVAPFTLDDSPIGGGAALPSAGANLGQLAVRTFTVSRYRDPLRVPVWMADGPGDSTTGDLLPAPAPAALTIRSYADVEGVGEVETPLPAGGRIEVWVG